MHGPQHGIRESETERLVCVCVREKERSGRERDHRDMEVFCDPPLFVKAQKTTAMGEDKLQLTVYDRVHYHYRSILLVYKSMKGAEEDVGEAATCDPVEVLRCGVEEIVSHYPWAAGRFQVDEGHRLEAISLKGDGGIQFASARASCALALLGDLAEPNPAFEPLFATVDVTAPLHARPLVALQVTKFQDDGICVSMDASHALFDGVAASIFLQNIFSIARGEGLCKPMDLAPRVRKIKPTILDTEAQPKSAQQEESILRALFTRDWTASYQSLYQEPLATTRIKFCKEDLAQLQEEAISKQKDCNIGFKRCSRLEALTAHLWRARAKSANCRDPSEEFRLRMPVNVRGRIVESTPLCNYIGNAVSTALPSATVQELRQKSLAFAVEKLQEAMRQVTAERFQAEVDCLERLGGSTRMLPASLSIASLLGTGFNEADFGWGKPAYIGHPYKQRCNLVIVSESDPQHRTSSSWNVFIVFDSPLQLQKFQDALRL